MLIKLWVKSTQIIFTMQRFFGMLEKESKEKRCLKKILMFYQRTGLWKSQTEREICWIKSTVIVVLLLVGIINGSYMFYLNYDNFKINTDVLLHIAISIHSLFVYLTFMYQQKTSKWLLNVLNTEFDHFEDSLFVKKTKFWKLEEKKTLFQINFIYYLILVTQVTYLFQTNFYSFDPSKRKLMYPLWFPFPLNNSSYYLALIFEILIFVIHLHVHIMSSGLFCCCTNLHSAITEIIAKILTNIHQSKMFKTVIKNELNTLCKYRRNEMKNCDLDELKYYLLKQFIKIHTSLKT